MCQRLIFRYAINARALLWIWVIERGYGYVKVNFMVRFRFIVRVRF